MATDPDYQITLFRQMEAVLPAQASLATAISDTLDISIDSAYRRIRGETELSIGEACRLCQAYELSLDAIFGAKGGAVTFFRGEKGPEGEIISKLHELKQHLSVIDSAREKEITFFSMELPIFHYMQVPEVLVFKNHYWELMAGKKDLGKIDLEETNAELRQAASDVLNTWLRIPGTEIIFEDAVASTLKQLQFLLEAGHFARPLRALSLFDKVSEMAAHLQEQARLGIKFRYGAPPPEQAPGKYRLFYNEMVYSENTALVRMDQRKLVFVEHNVLNFMHTSDGSFCDESEAMLRRIEEKSILISSVSEKERHKFFNRLQNRIEKAKARAEAMLED